METTNPDPDPDILNFPDIRIRLRPSRYYWKNYKLVPRETTEKKKFVCFFSCFDVRVDSSIMSIVYENVTIWNSVSKTPQSEQVIKCLLHVLLFSVTVISSTEYLTFYTSSSSNLCSQYRLNVREYNIFCFVNEHLI